MNDTATPAPATDPAYLSAVYLAEIVPAADDATGDLTVVRLVATFPWGEARVVAETRLTDLRRRYGTEMGIAARYVGEFGYVLADRFANGETADDRRPCLRAVLYRA